MKECFKCGSSKSLEQFYPHPAMADGHLNKCIECTKSDVMKHRSENLEKVRAYDRSRSALPHRVELNLKVNKAWRREDMRRQRAHSAVGYAKRIGLLSPQPCSRCGEVKSLAHHDDYDKPLSVTWLCQPCHKQRHKELDGAAQPSEVTNC